MEVEWMNHTGFVVSDMERSRAFYRDLLWAHGGKGPNPGR